MKRPTPLRAAFSTTAMAALFLFTGLLGYSLSHGWFEGTWTHARDFDGCDER